MDEILVKKLSYIKYLYSKAEDESRMSEPLCGFSILSLHNCIEMFLHLICVHNSINKKDNNFMTYWDVINNKFTDRELPDKMRFEVLNKARVGLKHYGNIPIKADIDAFRVNTGTFLKEQCKLFFNADFDDISMIDLIQYEKTRELLKEAGEYYSKGDEDNAAKCLAFGFEHLISKPEKIDDRRETWSPFQRIINLDINTNQPAKLPLDDFAAISANNNFEQLAEFQNNIVDHIHLIKDVIRILSLGVDYSKYVRFKTLTPKVGLAGDGSFYAAPFYLSSKAVGKYKPFSAINFSFCESFVIEVALKLQNMEKYTK